MKEKRTRKTGTNSPRALSAQIQHCHDVACNTIERDLRKPRISLPKPKHRTRWASGFCKLCGEHMDCVTHLHAESHGYKSAEEFIKAGNYAYD